MENENGRTRMIDFMNKWNGDISKKNREARKGKKFYRKIHRKTLERRKNINGTISFDLPKFQAPYQIQLSTHNPSKIFHLTNSFTKFDQKESLNKTTLNLQKNSKNMF